MARIVIEDLLDTEELTDAELEAIWGAGIGSWAGLAMGVMMAATLQNMPDPSGKWTELYNDYSTGFAGRSAAITQVASGLEGVGSGQVLQNMVNDIQALQQVQNALGMSGHNGDVMSGLQQAGFDIGQPGQSDVQLLETASQLLGGLQNLFGALETATGGAMDTSTGQGAVDQLANMIQGELAQKRAG